MDIIIRNGRVVDTINKTDKICDVAIKNGKIIGVGNFDGIECEKEIDAEGCIVTPGLIDFHIHLYPLTEIGVPAESLCFSSGVTTAVDAGSCGCSNYESFRSFLCSSKLRIKCYLNICSAGMVTGSYSEKIDPRYYNVKKIKRLFDKYGDDLIGLKIRMSKDITGDMELEPLKETLYIADELGVNVVVHSTNPPCSMGELASCLREGDVLTHSFHNIGHSIINESGHVDDKIIEAREKGIVFDAANARFHFAFKVACVAISEGFLPDIISTDLTVKSMYKKPQIFNLLFLMSKYLNMGLTLNEIIERVTINPAKLIGMENEIGSLSEGCCGDVTVLKIIDREENFEDWEGGKLKGTKLFKAMLTVREGEIVYRDIEF